MSNPEAVNAQQSVSFESWVSSHDRVSDDKYVYKQSSGIHTEGGFSHLFTRSSVNAATVRALQQEIVSKYGEQAGEALSDKFAQFASGKKQITMGAVRDIFRAAQLIRINTIATSIGQHGSAVGNALSILIGDDVEQGRVLTEQAMANANRIEQRLVNADPNAPKLAPSRPSIEPLLQFLDSTDESSRTVALLRSFALSIGTEEDYAKAETCLKNNDPNAQVSMEDCKKLLSGMALLHNRFLVSDTIKKTCSQDSLFQKEVSELSGEEQIDTQARQRDLRDEELQQFGQRLQKHNLAAQQYQMLYDELTNGIPQDSLCRNAIIAQFKKALLAQQPCDEQLRSQLQATVNTLVEQENALKTSPQAQAAYLCEKHNLQGEAREILTEFLVSAHNSKDYPKDFLDISLNSTTLVYGIKGAEIALDSLTFSSGLGEDYVALPDKQSKLDYLAAISFAGSAFSAAVSSKLAEMRALQPQGLLTPATVCKALFGTEPKLVNDQNEPLAYNDLTRLFENQASAFLLDRITTLEPKIVTDPMFAQHIANIGTMWGTYGFDLDKIIHLICHPGQVVDKSHFNLDLKAYTPRAGETVADATALWLNDFHRQQTKTCQSSITIQTDGAPYVISNDMTGMSEEEHQAFRANQPIPMLARAIEYMKTLCTNNGQVNTNQLTTLLGALSQTGPVKLLRIPAMATGISGSAQEHSPMDYTITKDDMGNIILTLKSPATDEGTHLDACYTIAPDGTNTCLRMTMTPPQARD